jgi:signal transduction histidine kinase
LESYCQLLSRLLQALDIVQQGPQQIQLNPHRVFFLKSVIAPAIRFATPLLRRRNFPHTRIRYRDFDVIPAIYVDATLMTQVVFNLLENAIKYAQSDPAAFYIEISPHASLTTFDISIRDWGMGIDPSSSDSVFEEGFRGRAATKTPGTGLGLTVARSLVQRHGGDLLVTSASHPTEFTIRLPRSLSDRPPE